MSTDKFETLKTASTAVEDLIEELRNIQEGIECCGDDDGFEMYFSDAFEELENQSGTINTIVSNLQSLYNEE